ncbi:MAG: cation:proton antiporter, partial [Nitrospinota bacterium]
MHSIKKPVTGILLLSLIITVCQLSITHYNPYSHATFVLGILILTGFLTGKIFQSIRLPAITGYLITGVLLGPFFLEEAFSIKGIITRENISALNLINNIALGLIAFTAGGELNFSRLKNNIGCFFKLSLYQLFIIFLGVSAATGLLLSFFTLTRDLSINQILVFSIVAGSTATAISPATTIAVIQECKAKGEVAETVLGITIIKDILVIILFSITLSIGITILTPNHSFDYFFFGTLIWKLAG